MAQAPLFTRPVARALACTLGVLLTAVLVTTAMPSYLPVERANSVVMPIVLFPVTWLALFLWVLFERRVWLAWLVLLLVSGASAAIALNEVGIL